jgi:DNA-binding CsgD family transcriptional regulator
MQLQDFSKTLAQLYKAAERAEPDKYLDELLMLIRQLIRFDGAIIGMARSAEQPRRGLVIERAHVFKRVNTLIQDYMAIAACDPIMKTFMGVLSEPLRIDCKSLYEQSGTPELSRFAAKHDLHKVMLYRVAPNANGITYGVVLIRANGSDFDQSEGALLQALWPHVVESIALNLKRALESIDPHVMSRPLALINSHGMIDAVNDAMVELLKLEWQDCDARCLPVAVMSSLINVGVYRGKRIEISAGSKFGYIACIARRIPLIESLSQSERNVVERFAKGMTHKEIASHLQVSVHTVRNQIAHAYQKLGVHSKAELARKLTSRQAR